MSGGSDSDEFYDAEEVTPSRNKRPSFTNVDHPKLGDTSINLEEVERKILQERQAAEERRRQEDEELQRKLEAVKLLKMQQKEKETAALRAREQEQRRRKLEEMRLHVSDDSTPRPPAKPPRLSPDGEGSTSATPTSSRSHSPALHSPEENDTPTASSPPRSLPDPAKTRSLPQIPSISLPPEDGADSVNFNQPCAEKMASKSMADLTTVEETEAKEEPGEEPDIIQSVKSSSLGRETPALPVAPPRKKRKNKSERESSPAETPTSTVYSLTQELERSLDLQRAAGHETRSIHSLDIHAAVKGKRLVTATEEASAKAEDSASQSDNMSLGSSLDGDADVRAKRAQRKQQRQQQQQEQHQHLPMQQVDADQLKTLPEEEVFTVRVGTQAGGEVPLSLLRPRSNSGSRFLTDKEILDSVTVLNLDTGENVPLSRAEEKLPRCINPLSLHIMRRTKEYSSDSSLHKEKGSDNDDAASILDGNQTLKTVKPLMKKRGKKLKKMLGKTAKKLKIKTEGSRGDAGRSSSDEEDIDDNRRLLKIKASNSHKGPYDFDLLVPVQDLVGVHVGAVWCMKFSPCGRLLATGGQDNLLRVWVLKDAFCYFDDMRNKYNEASKQQVSPAPSQDSLSATFDVPTPSSDTASNHEESEEERTSTDPEDDEDWFAPFRKRPLQVYNGHSADLLDISWSKNYFLLSASMDKTVRLWHVSRGECLCCFQHIDFVTAIAFHPKDDRYFLSGSLDGKLRLWSIPDKKVALWNEVSGHSKLITAANFCLNGRFAVVGTYDGRCVFYSTEQLKYFTQIHVRSTRGKNARGRKITGIEPFPGEDKILVTSNDSRIRLYDLRDLTLTCKFKGCANNSSQIKACFSHNGKYIVCGSEDHFVYIWQTQHEFYKFSSARRDRSDYWEGIKAHNAVVTSAIFAPVPKQIIKPQFEYVDSDDRSTTPEIRGEVLVSADYNGTIKVFINKFKPGS